MGRYVPLCNTVRRTEAGSTLTKRKRGEDYNSDTDDGDTDNSS
ncbi:hypothetical protein PPTG_24955 [Phytophthora nicotianae INRA-310]|uniref:Uncharacterized protein n=3 Tax=Phytophthora nicotianae TaxID=4792 RepID=W2P8U5_PHYN3|nr:hypothetical protein PPTG_24955 [Phytophthora nicotianae INRA-310]ETL42083.1 hypothetical protein L916_07043 [Phytophthora nicotianae]ETM97432.1 hypothetical protein PPTG_24955 [Phytophthora nicotianae INRA-310]ETO77533.1 hypothetical protein F444_07282 [Phytophthora nicotianae P1976]